MILISGCSAHKIVAFILVKKKRKRLSHSCCCGKANFSYFVSGERKADNLVAWTDWEIEVCDGLQVSIAMYQF